MLIRRYCLELSGNMVIEDDDRAREDDPVTIKREPLRDRVLGLSSRKPQANFRSEGCDFLSLRPKSSE